MRISLVLAISFYESSDIYSNFVTVTTYRNQLKKMIILFITNTYQIFETKLRVLLQHYIPRTLFKCFVTL